MAIARATKATLKEADALKDPEGRPNKREAVEEWQRTHQGRKADCIRDTKLDRKTVSKYWKQ